MTLDLANHAGIPLPETTIYHSDPPNTFALSVSRDPGVLAVSTAPLRLLDRNEIRGVVAHEIAHLKNLDSLLSISAGLFVRGISAVSTVFGFLILLLARDDYFPAELFSTGLLVVGAPFVAPRPSSRTDGNA